MIGFFKLCKHKCNAAKIAPIRDHKLNLPGLPSVITSLSPVSKNLLKFESCSMLSFGKRHYCVERNQNGEFKTLIKYLGFLSVFGGKFETVPFKKQIVLVFPFFDKLCNNLVVKTSKELRETWWNGGKKVGDMLPDTDTQCVRVRAIARKVVDELQKGTGRHHTLAENQKGSRG